MKLKRGVWRVSDKVKKKKEKKGGEKKFGRNGRLIDVETWRCLQRMNRQEREREDNTSGNPCLRHFYGFRALELTWNGDTPCILWRVSNSEHWISVKGREK